ncbi:adenylate isopentenyltransferase 7 mitochondrial [Phtheirospermum japonicum]|uniref:Adenylate isopentenyltransferase 7 mitochondrial n=1 Tax=Phtheirospermum japonicum TaxID=374723 RepID=A0A830BDP6_9LAMI|nr:adenylate isopentenyltransferase 7 mitochondrial [Phtheirospermum japonicum]
MGATGTGKSRLAIDLATTFGGEIINCDKIQVYKGLDLIANKVTEVECRGVPHHLLGLVAEAREFFGGDCSRGIRRAIGVPEMDGFFKMEGSVEAEARADLLKAAVEEIKVNTCKLTHRQLEKIFTIGERLKWQGVHRLDATEVYLRRSGDVAEDVWQRLMVGPGTRIVSEFLGGGEEDVKESKSSHFASNVASAMDNN